MTSAGKRNRTIRRLRIALSGRRSRYSTKAAALYMCGSAFGFAAMSLCVRAMTQGPDGLHPSQAFFLRMLFGLLVLLPWVLRHRNTAFHAKRPVLMITRSAIGVCAGTLYFFSLAILPLSQAVALNFTLPLFTAIGGVLFLHERFRWRRWCALGFGFLGVLVIAQPFGGTMHVALLLPLVAALGMACITLIIKVLSRTETPGRLLFWHQVWGTALVAPPAFFVWSHASPGVWLAAIASGAFGSISMLMATRSLRAAEAGFVIVFDYLRLPVTALGAWLFFAEPTEPATWFGGVMIAGAGAYVAHRELVRKGRKLALRARAAVH